MENLLLLYQAVNKTRMEVTSFVKVIHGGYNSKNGTGKEGSGPCILGTPSMACRRTTGLFYLTVGDLLEARRSISLIWSSTSHLVNF